MRLFSFLLVLCSFTASLHAQDATYISMQPVKLSYSPATFCIGKVVDSRTEKGAFGSVENETGGRSQLAMKNGLAASLQEFIARNVSQDKTKPAITLHITSLRVTISNTNGMWVTEAVSGFAFYAGDRKLLEFGDKGQQRSSRFSMDYAEQFIRTSFASSLKRFDEWAANNKSRLTTPAAQPNKPGSSNGSEAPPARGDKPYLDKAEATKAFELLNKIRTDPNAYLPAMGIHNYSGMTNKKLVWNETLAKAAEAKAMDMAKRNYFSHVSPEGYGMNYLISKEGDSLNPEWLEHHSDNFFESIQAGAPDGEAAIKDLILDEGVPELGHRKHLLGMGEWNCTLVDVGIGTVVTAAGSEFRTYTSVIIAKHK